MNTGYFGTFVIAWSQTEVDGLPGAPARCLTVGAAWSWRGNAVQVDGADSPLRLDQAIGTSELHRRAARIVRRLVGTALDGETDLERPEVSHPLADSGFVVTDGAQSYAITLIEVGLGAPPLLMFCDGLPPRGTDLWIVQQSISAHVDDPRSTAASSEAPRRDGGMVCFTPGTMISTPNGPKPVETLQPGDRVSTMDCGAQDVLWTGRRRMTGARLFAYPALRPIWIKAGALGIDRPDQAFLVSPDHQMLINGAPARALFNTSEVLVSARDLVNGSTIAVDTSVREVTYVHLLLSSHQIVWANGVATESYHPANAAPGSLSPGDEARLREHVPALADDPFRYGSFARRCLSASEAAILRHEAA